MYKSTISVHLQEVESTVSHFYINCNKVSIFETIEVSCRFIEKWLCGRNGRLRVMKIEKQLIDMLAAIQIIQSELILQFKIYAIINLFKN